MPDGNLRNLMQHEAKKSIKNFKFSAHLEHSRQSARFNIRK